MKTNIYSAHLLELCETALINCLIVVIIYVCSIFVSICVYGIARTGCYIGPWMDGDVGTGVDVV